VKVEVHQYSSHVDNSDLGTGNFHHEQMESEFDIGANSSIVRQSEAICGSVWQYVAICDSLVKCCVNTCKTQIRSLCNTW
jgi:hypothetical protein